MLKIEIKNKNITKSELKKVLYDEARNLIYSFDNPKEAGQFLIENNVFSIKNDETNEMVFGIKGRQIRSVGNSSYVLGFKTMYDALACKLFFDNYIHLNELMKFDDDESDYHELPYIISKNIERNKCSVTDLFEIKVYDNIFEAIFYDEDSGFSYGTKAIQIINDNICGFGGVNLFQCMSLIMLHEYFKSL